jgi:hypothetical protein
MDRRLSEFSLYSSNLYLETVDVLKQESSPIVLGRTFAPRHYLFVPRDWAVGYGLPPLIEFAETSNWQSVPRNVVREALISMDCEPPVSKLNLACIGHERSPHGEGLLVSIVQHLIAADQHFFVVGMGEDGSDPVFLGAYQPSSGKAVLFEGRTVPLRPAQPAPFPFG